MQNMEDALNDDDDDDDDGEDDNDADDEDAGFWQFLCLVHGDVTTEKVAQKSLRCPPN